MSTRVRNGRVDLPRRRSEEDEDGAKPWERVGGLPTKAVSEVARESCSFAVFCDTGTGKTVLASTVLDWPNIKVSPEVGHKMMYWIDCDGGLRPVRSWDEEIRYATVLDYAHLKAQVDDLAQGKGRYFSAICLDTGSEGADLCMEVTLKDQGKDEPDWLSWRDNSRKFTTEIIRPLRNVGRKYGIPVIFTYWLREEKNKETGRVMSVAPELNPALITRAMAAVDLAIFLEVLQDEETRCAHLFATKRTKAKLRTDLRLAADRTVPPFMCNPSLVPLLETLVDGKPFPSEGYGVPDGMTPRFSQRFRKQVEAAEQTLTREERRARRAERNGGEPVGAAGATSG